MNNVNINGRTINVPDGASVSIINNRVIVDGVEWSEQGEDLQGVVRVEITGYVENLRTDASVTVHGNVNGDVDAGGAVKCGKVAGNVRAGGSVKCDDVGLSVNAGGSVKARTIGGTNGR